MNDRRSFLRNILAGGVLIGSPLPPVTKSPQQPRIPVPTFIDFEVFKPCDFHFDEDCSEIGFEINIYDVTNHRDYEGYIKWWALSHDEDSRDNAIYTGYAKLINGFASVVYRS